MGSSDEIAYHGGNRGTYAVNVLDPPMPPFDMSEYDIYSSFSISFRLSLAYKVNPLHKYFHYCRMHSWNMTVDMIMPEDTTTYWCSIHKSPPLSTKNHIVAVGFHLMT